ncbi:hypothetical protein DFJ74DRAFT_673489 [Hyaloraphidium curvatum]|nr:hypothetical protein DFJ74DRAFT_673489 [Hyaloraphidium curvatum]
MAARRGPAAAALLLLAVLLALVALCAAAPQGAALAAPERSPARALSHPRIARRQDTDPDDDDEDEDDEDDDDDDQEGLEGQLEDYDSDGDDSDADDTPTNATAPAKPRPAAVPINLYSPNLAIRIPLGIVLLLGGLYWCFLGYRNFRASMFIAGLLVGTMFMYVLLANFRPAGGYNVASESGLFIGASLAVGIVFGVGTVFLWPVGLFFIGALGGFFFALFIEGWKTGGTVTSRPGQIALLVIPTFTLAVLPLVFERPSVIVGTTITGSYITIMGIDAFVRTGFDVLIMSYMHARLPGFFYLVTPRVYGMLGGVMGFCLAGLLFQFLLNKEGVHWNRPPWRRKKRGKGYLNLMSVSSQMEDDADTKVAPNGGAEEVGPRDSEAGEGDRERVWDSVPADAADEEEGESKPTA